MSLKFTHTVLERFLRYVRIDTQSDPESPTTPSTEKQKDLGRLLAQELCDLGIADATGGKVIAHLVKANNPPADGTGWHYHVCQFQIVLMTTGWAKFMYEDKVTLVEAGDVVHQRPGMVHYLFDYSPDMEYLEIVSPADFKSVDAPAATPTVPAVTPW